MRNIHAQITSEYGQENVKASNAGKNLNIKWQIFQTIGDSTLDALAKA